METLGSALDPRIASEVTSWVAGPGGTAGVGSSHGSVIDLPPATERPAPRRRRVHDRDHTAASWGSLIDRSAELAATTLAVAKGSAVVLYGPPGIGKTALLRRVRDEVALARPACLVSCPTTRGRGQGAVRDLLQDAFEQLYQREPGIVRPAPELARLIAASGAVMLVDDANEHCAELPALMDEAQAPALILATDTEWHYPDATRVPLSGLELEDGVALAERVLGGFVEDAERTAATRLSATVHGHPQQILDSVAYARATGLPLDTVVAELAERDAAALGVALAARLTPGQREVLAALEVVASATPEQLAAITGVPETQRAIARLEHLQLAQEGERGQVSRVARATSLLQTGTELGEALDGSIEFLVRAIGQHQFAVEAMLGETAIALHVLELACKEKRHKDVVRLGRACSAALILALRLGAAERVLELVGEAASALDDPATQAWALHELGVIAFILGDPERAFAMFTRSLAFRDAVSDPTGVALTNRSIAVVEQQRRNAAGGKLVGGRSHERWWGRLLQTTTRWRMLVLISTVAVLAAAGYVLASARGPALLPAPTDLRAASPTRLRPALSWQSVARAADYRVTRQGGGLPVVNWTGTATHRTVPAPSHDGTFRFSVAAIDRRGRVGGSAERTVIVDRTPPPAPASFRGIAASKKITLVWTAASGASAYRVTDLTTSLVRRTPATSMIVHVPRAGTYRFALRSEDSAGNISPAVTTVVKATETAIPVLTAPRGLSGTPEHGVISLHWEPLEGATAYRVDDRTTGWSKIVTETGATEPVRPGKSYTYAVAGIDRLHRHGSAATTTVASSVVTIGTPALSSDPAGGTPTRKLPTLRWSPVAGATTYQVLREGPGGELAREVKDTSLTETALAADGTYTYTVRALGSGSSEGASSNQVAIVYDTTAPAPPRLVVAKPVGGHVELSWDKESDAEAYIVTDTGTSRTVTVTKPAAQETPAGPGTYTYTVASVDRAGNASIATPVKATIALQAPTLEAINPNPTREAPALAWSAVPGAASYEIQRTGPSARAWSVSATTTSDDVPGADGTYGYEVRGVTSGGVDGPWSQAETVTLDTTPPASPALLTVRTDGTTSTISWASSPEATTYRLTDTKTSKQLANGTSRTATENEPGPGAYAFGIVAVDAAGNVSSPPTAGTVTVLGAPVLKLSGVTQRPPVLGWTAVAGATRYKVSRTGTQAPALTFLVTSTGMTDTKAAPDISYSYSVVALDTAGDVGIPSNTVANTYDPPLTAPANIKITRSPDGQSIQVTWQVVPRADHYVVSRNSKSLGPVSAPSFLDGNPVLCASATYSIVAVSASGSSGPPGAATYSPVC